MKPFKNKLAVTIVVLSVAFLGIITFSIKSNSTIISSGVGGVISPLQKIVHVVNKKVKESFEFFINFSNVKKENEELSAKNAELENKLDTTDCVEELKFTPRDILLKRDIDFINKVKLEKKYKESTKTWKDYTRQEHADLIMKYVDNIELDMIGKEIIVKQVNFRDLICKPCQELFDNGYIDTTKPMILGNVLGSVRFSNYLPEGEVGEIIMRLRQYYDVHYTEAIYYVDKQMFYFNLAEDNSAIVRVFPLED